ncbi:hypothetical protein Y032_0002g753 [Ancylostoma ceylanicum]|uniref:Reverse transcriptase domain-containing protein n=1 Tax=Ancylostoma ceylanicum TaxID=53326 RepID=A0A016W246_9BILA|nr:hypothetical protein Y032_0002g753 [Ancylostoma ceylanicum]
MMSFRGNAREASKKGSLGVRRQPDDQAGYIYLGQAIRMDNDLRLELLRRRKAGWTAFSKIDVLLKSKDIPAQTKSQLFHSSVLPALLYGCETWNLTRAEERSLQVTQRAMERQMLGISRLEHKKNEEIREIT